MSLYDESTFYEIIELENGDVALRRSESTKNNGNNPLVEIRFSEESQYFLGQAKFDVAKTMIEAGLDLVAELSEAEADIDSAIATDTSHVLH